MCEPGRTRARPSRSVRTTTILKSAWSLAREARRSFLLASRRLRETPPIWRSGARGHIRPRAMGDESPPRSRSPAPRDDRSRSPAPRDDRSRSPRAATRPPAGATTRAAAAAPRAEMIAARPPATDPPVTAAAADARPASPGDGTLAVSVRAVNPRIAPLVPFCLARARDPSPGSDNSRSSSFSRYFHPPDSNTGSRARPPEKHARSSFRPSSPGSTVTSKRVATRRVDASSRTSSVRPHPHHT